MTEVQFNQIPARLSSRANVSEAMQHAGHNFIQWQRFYLITKEEAHALLQKNSRWNWKDVPADEKAQIRSRVNASLVSEEIPVVDDDVFYWRMTILIHDIRGWLAKKNATASTSAPLNPANSPAPPNYAPFSAQPQSIANSAPPKSDPFPATQQPPSRSYDPVRDVYSNAI
ncbi:hypothetical protein K491DRAFT_669910 [Lophiostoma macrostomum CBS 122681]|uniref:Uncharacterized protein n=1 Tax=Lophiostoma macrostomum CBS 122681 TaxID=1314788 RepID=A0A6A6SRQ0_9PLEO|nr:hypothetical protein K491DRAFT_669910 [Lophiostoma macrostomum CBS 122681]